MMSRITLDLKKRGKEHIHYNLSRNPMVGDGEGPYCYQMSPLRFRDIITGGKSMPRSIGIPRESTWKPSLRGSGAAVPVRGPGG